MNELDLTNPEVERTVAALVSRYPAFAAHERFITARLTELAHRCYQHGHSAALVSLLSLEEAAQQLNVTPMWVSKLSHRHGIGERFGRAWVFRPEDVERLRGLIRQKRGSKQPAS